MQTLVAWSARTPVGSETLSAATDRVESHYGQLWPPGWVRHEHDGAAAGLRLWDAGSSTCRWPSWSERDGLVTASLYVPLGFEGVAGTADPDLAPSRLARSLVASPAAILDLAPPFVLAFSDAAADRLWIFTDALGVGRLFVLRTASWTVWSNRPDAVCLFAGMQAEVDPVGWRHHAGLDHFLGGSSPVADVVRVGPATQVAVDARGGTPVTTTLDRTSLFAPGPTSDLDEVADALRRAATSVGRLWPGRVTVDLSGGRDSRVVAAAFVAAGVDVVLHTHDAVPGEAEVAQHLVGLLPDPPPHELSRSSAVRRSGAAPAIRVVERVVAWHAYAEGLRPASFLAHTPPTTLSPLEGAAVSGAGGEMAHGHYHPADLAALDRLDAADQLQACRDQLLQRMLPVAGLRAAAVAEISAQLDRVLRQGHEHGLAGATLLDHFYLDARLPRWGTTAERLGVVAPLLTPQFVRGVFSSTAQDRTGVHRELLARLVPAWAGVPFYKGTTVRRPSGRQRLRLGEAADREQLHEVFSRASRWAGDFDPRVVDQVWAASLAGRSTHLEELLLWRLLWRDLYPDHLRATHGTPAVPRTRVPAPSAVDRLESAAVPVLRAANRSRLARAARRTRVGRELAASLRHKVVRGGAR